MKLSKRLLEAINRGLRMGLELDDEITDVPVFKKSDNKKVQTYVGIFNDRLEQMLPDAKDAANMSKDEMNKFYYTGIEHHKKYGATYNPHLDGLDFRAFIECILTSRVSAFNDNVVEIDLNWIDTSEVTEMSALFAYDNNDDFIHSSQFDLRISDWDVSNVTGMGRLFAGCWHFNDNISKWDVHNVRNMNAMFHRCYEFNSDISKWDVSNVEDMSWMFYDCNNFNLNISNWNTSNVKYMYSTFSGAKEFNLDLSKWDVSNVEDMSWLFAGCTNFKQDLSKWNTNHVISHTYMFNNGKMPVNYRPHFID